MSFVAIFNVLCRDHGIVFSKKKISAETVLRESEKGLQGLVLKQCIIRSRGRTEKKILVQVVQRQNKLCGQRD